MLLTIHPNPKNGNGNTNSDYRVNSAAILYEYNWAGTMAGADRREVTVGMAARTWYRAAGTPQKPDGPTIPQTGISAMTAAIRNQKHQNKSSVLHVLTGKNLETLPQHCSIVIQYIHSKTYDTG